MTGDNRQIAKEWARVYPSEEEELKEYEKDQEYLECVKDILDNPIFQSMDDFIQHGDTTCKDHCIQVSYLSYCICKKRGWDYRQAARGALLHDLFLYDWHFHARETGNHFHGLTHPKTAMDNASRYFELTAMEKNIILRHMWPLTPVPPKYKEGFVIVYADKHCGLKEVVAHAKGWAKHALVPRRFARYL